MQKEKERGRETDRERGRKKGGMEREGEREMKETHAALADYELRGETRASIFPHSAP